MNKRVSAAEQDWLVTLTDGPQDVALVGGKGASLLQLAKAGFPVPPFFIVTTAAWRAAVGEVSLPSATDLASDEAHRAAKIPEFLQKRIAAAYEQIGGGPVAVRSSAVAEDSAEASFAGQQETILGVNGLEALLQAIVRCWESGQSERARAYRTAKWGAQAVSSRPSGTAEAKCAVAERNIAAPNDTQAGPPDEFPMAVVVQRLIAAEVAGVVFTRDPTDATGEHLLVEAAWGLGEGVVSGKVMPDRYRVRRADGTVATQEIADKRLRISEQGEEALAEDLRHRPCLTPEQLAELARLALRVESFYGQERDVEWAFAGGQFWLLQARPITTVTAWEREAYRQSEIQRLQQLASPNGTVWARYNLAESVSLPTPMTWAVLRHFMSGRGGYGLLLRDLGFDPDPSLDEAGFLDLVCGRPYVNLSREPLCYFRHFPLCYPLAALKADPSRALYPKAQLDRSRLNWRFWLHLPGTFWKMLRQTVRLNRMATELPDWLRREVYPAFSREAQAARQESLTGLSDLAVWERFRYWQERTLASFARQALRPTVVLGHLLGSLEQMVRKRVPPGEAASIVRQLLVGVQPDPEADVAQGLRKLASGQWSREEFLRRFGHRGEQELELAQPRWEEAPETLPFTFATPPTLGEPNAPIDAADHFPADFDALWTGLAQRYGWSGAEETTLRQLTEQARVCAALRETSRHYLLLGYSVLRRCLLELGQRWQLGEEVFYLTPEEIEGLLGLRGGPQSLRPVAEVTASPVPREKLSLVQLREVLRQRRRQRQIAQSLEVPTVVFSDELESLGRPLAVSGAAQLQGIAVSPGVAEGPALVLRQPHCAQPPPFQGYVLVCPSTDPAWVPLFLRAKALVMETGGVLSHGAIVAREFGLPAVVGITDACQRFRTGQRLRVNGNTGQVQLLAD